MRYLKHSPDIGLWYPKVLNLNCLVIRTPIMPVERLIEEVIPVVVNFLDVLLYLGHQRIKILWFFLPPRRNISRREVVVLNYYE
jgi:hypothetical protein